ncbi:hypothetical protein N7520_000367 [Penicillium odoratum]|uniref:uncharacterized protein n=1 Tax=Penicillium odoratum TaxID=1167516 RepID=UPI00254743C5|nr:uncharacterized protein N7520_000367 [Penicillium odoratum]KAJ5777121.1 hypothetical protein N7520_000367 [Penicillium odoratum]
MEVANTEGIISILRERDILIKRDVIESAMEDPAAGPGNAKWMSKHLRPETLLSTEELSLYTKLENSGALQPILRDPGLDATRPFLEDDMRSTIRSLEASTAIIQQKSRTLTAQCEMLKKKLHRQEGLEQNRSRDIARLRKKHEGAKQNITIVANDLSDELDAGFRSETDKTGAESKRILSLLSSRLKHDDRLLSTLEKLMPVVKSNFDDASTVKRAAHLSEALADYSAEEIHYRLDRLYLEESMQAGDLNSLSGAEGATITALEEELEALYPEIEILAEMSTKQQFHEPILREIYNGHSLLRETLQQKLEQILDVLIDMTLSKQELTAQLANRESLCELLEQITILYQAESTNQLVTQSSSRRESIRRRSLQPGMVLGATRKPASMPEQPSLENLLRRIGLSPESVLRPQVEDGGAQGLYEKRIDMSEAIRNLEIAAESPLVSNLGDSDSASQLLASSLHGNAQFGTSLRNSRQEGALLGLETELASLQKGVQGLNLNVLHQRDKTQAKFLERWG